MNSPESGGQSPVAKLYEDAENQPESVETLMRRGGELDFVVTNIAARLGANEIISEEEIATTQGAVSKVLPKLMEAKARTGEREKLAILDYQIVLLEEFQKRYPKE